MSSTFKLQTVLDVRQLREDQAKQELASALQQEAQLLSTICAQEEALRSLYSEFDQRQQQGMAGHELQLYQNRISYQVQRLGELAVEMDRLQRLVGRRRAALLEASRERQLMEKLKEKHLDEVRQETRRRETSALDEIALRTRR